MTQQGQVATVVWVAAFVASVAGSAALSASRGAVTLDMTRVQDTIRARVNAAANTDSTVTCPSGSTYQVHDTFICTATDSTGSIDILVTIQDRNGYITFQA